MYSKFNLTISDAFYSNELKNHLEIGQSIFEKHETQAKKNLKEFICDNEHIDGSEMKSNWFQIEDVDIFISHSHQDITKVKAFAGWLYDEFNLTAFIDSCAWGYCNDLLGQIDNNYCKKGDGKTYDYNLRNYTTSHVHMMLSVALSEMINNTECIMFYNTPNSISLPEDLKKIKEEHKRVTLSPWIYYELAMTSLVKKRKPNRTISLCENYLSHKAFSEKNNINIQYDVDKYLKDMISIEENELNSWKEFYLKFINNSNNGSVPSSVKYNCVHPLDVLYYLPAINNKSKEI